MAITPLPTPPLRSDPTNFAARGDAFLGALPQFQVEANALASAMNLNSTTDSSTSSITIGTGAKTFVVSSGKSFQPGMYLVIADVTAPSTNSMFGQITTYSGTSLVMSIISVRGSGTKSSWVISQSSAGGAQAGPLASSGITGAAASGANTDITSITGNAATATAAKSGYFTVAHETPKLEIHKYGVISGMWTINAVGKFSFTTTDGSGTVFTELMTISPSGVLSMLGGFDGNAATATTATTATTALNAIGYGQTWQNLTGSRALSTTYSNTTGKPIYISITFISVSNGTASLTVNGIVLDNYAISSNTYFNTNLKAIIPNGVSYSATSNATISVWAELR